MSSFSEMMDNRRNKVYLYLRRETLKWFIEFIQLANTILLVGFVIAGCLQIGLAVKQALSIGIGSAPTSSDIIDAMQIALKGVEFILLAPLSYVFLSALGHFVTELEEEDGEWRDAFHAVVGVKSLAISLITSLVAVELASKVLRDAELPLEKTLLQCLFLALLIVLLFVLDRGVAKER